MRLGGCSQVKELISGYIAPPFIVLQHVLHREGGGLMVAEGDQNDAAQHDAAGCCAHAPGGLQSPPSQSKDQDKLPINGEAISRPGTLTVICTRIARRECMLCT